MDLWYLELSNTFSWGDCYVSKGCEYIRRGAILARSVKHHGNHKNNQRCGRTNKSENHKASNFGHQETAFKCLCVYVCSTRACFPPRDADIILVRTMHRRCIPFSKKSKSNSLEQLLFDSCHAHFRCMVRDPWMKLKPQYWFRCKFLDLFPQCLDTCGDCINGDS